ncbi:hypothetical protein ACP2AV_07390 [Aliiroseovarius sp. PTFE2010]|uniref:hypothetical protein n=1 Tax=Aliiroseovarius sp. PTFE2010 TaxID=3417190 RepID=UPI003CF58EDC
MKEILKKHRASVKALGYTEDQADDLIHRLSAIMSAFIDAAWGVHPAQLSMHERDKKSLSEPSQCARIRTKPKHIDTKGPAASPAEE